MNVDTTRIISYVVSGIAAVVAGIVVSGYVGESYLSLGDTYLFSSIAAVAIGGASILGGSGRYAGTVAGALILTVLVTLLDILNLGAGVLEVVYGGVILLTVGIANIQTRGSTS